MTITLTDSSESLSPEAGGRSRFTLCQSWPSHSGVIFLDEVVGPLALVGTGLVVPGAWITSRPES